MSVKTIYRNVRKTKFTQINNSMLWDKELTLQAKGLLSIFLSNSNDWELNMKEIIKRSKNGRDGHYNVVTELIEKGYFARIEINGKSGFESMQYVFSDNPNDIEEELNQIEKSIPEDKYVYVEYKDRKDKQKRKLQSETDSLNEDIENAVNNTLTESQDAPNNTLTESQDTGSPYADNQYINNTNGNNTNHNNTKNDEEEEKITRAHEDSFMYQILNDYLKTKAIDQPTIDKTIIQLYERGIMSFMLKDVKKQYEHMMKKLQFDEVDNHNNFALYFVNGLQMRRSQSVAGQKYIAEKEQEYEEMMNAKNERDTSFYYNWLEDAET